MRQRIEVAGRIAAPDWAVWAMIRDMDLGWHPDVASCRVEGGVRKMVMPGGAEVVERLVLRSDSARRLVYRLEGSQYQAEMRLLDEGAVTRLVWSANPTADSETFVRKLFERGITALNDRLSLRSQRFGDLAALTAGVGAPVIFLHGIGGTKENWSDQLQAVAGFAHGIALDLAGYGESALRPGPITLGAILMDIETIRISLKAEKIHLVGLSMGAWIGASYAQRFGAHMASLTASGGFLGMTEAPEAVRKGFLAARLGPLDAGETPRSLAAGVWARLKGPQAGAQVEAGFLASMAAIPAEAYCKALHFFTEPPFTFDFTRFDMPILAMTGEHDGLAPPTEIAGVAERIVASAAAPLVSFEVISGAGHLCNMEAPAAYNRLLVAFLKGQIGR